jgi:transposase-like protein
MAKSRARDLAKEAVWRRRLDRHADSGQTVRAWCRRHGVKEAVFHWWRRELARRNAEQAPSVHRDGEAQAGSFVPVHVTDGPARAGDGQIEIELTDGRRVRVTGTVNREMLTQVLDVLERRAC